MPERVFEDALLRRDLSAHVEMLAGAKAFDGADATEMIAAVVRTPTWLCIHP